MSPKWVVGVLAACVGVAGCSGTSGGAVGGAGSSAGGGGGNESGNGGAAAELFCLPAEAGRPCSPGALMGVVGGPCVSDADCAFDPPGGPPTQGTCIKEGAKQVYAGGYCSFSCKSSSDCPVDSLCLLFEEGKGMCHRACADACDCSRTGYTCAGCSHVCIDTQSAQALCYNPPTEGEFTCSSTCLANHCGGCSSPSCLDACADRCCWLPGKEPAPDPKAACGDSGGQGGGADAGGGAGGSSGDAGGSPDEDATGGGYSSAVHPGRRPSHEDARQVGPAAGPWELGLTFRWRERAGRADAFDLAVDDASRRPLLQVFSRGGRPFARVGLRITPLQPGVSYRATVSVDGGRIGVLVTRDDGGPPVLADQRTANVPGPLTVRAVRDGRAVVGPPEVRSGAQAPARVSLDPVDAPAAPARS
ncbi:MAG: hypothetical protein AMXMBFR64_49970 [Myxococcales bacterium]